MENHFSMEDVLARPPRDVVLSLLPRRHAVEISGRHVAGGLLAQLAGGCSHTDDCCKGPGVCTHGCAPSTRLVDGPGCTPVRAYVDHHQEEEPANIPVRRQVDGRWQTVMITRDEWNEDQEDDEDGRRRYCTGHLWDEECPECE
jgi:hypothetical protein